MGADRSTIMRRGALVALSATVAAASVAAGCGEDDGAMTARTRRPG